MNQASGTQPTFTGSLAGPLEGSAPRLGPFELIRQLGSGNTGKVFAAREQRSGALVALKVVALVDTDGSGAPETAREHFARESLAVGKLRHPGLAEVLGSGQADGHGWLVMELAPGTSLMRYTQLARLLPPEVVASLGRRVALALAYMHREGVLHRDVKPANVIVDWSSDSLKLVDFGLARWAGHSITRSGQLIGSPDYMAPELLAGAEAGPAADMYALGVTLYELLAGRRPHSAPTLGALLRAAAHDPAPELAELRPDVPEALCRAVMSLLAKEPARRVADAAGLSHTLAGPSAAARPAPA